MQVPVVPGLPRPGINVPPPSVSELITLKSFNIHSSSSTLNLEAEAALVDPAPPNIDFTSPPLEFVSLPIPSNSSSNSSSSLSQNFISNSPSEDGDNDDSDTEETLPIASISSLPFSLTHPNITLHLSGRVLPFAPSSSSFKVLSTFFGRCLSGLPGTIFVSLSPTQPGNRGGVGMPDALKGLKVLAEFPAPNPRPRVLQNVTIRDIKLKPTRAGGGGGLLASGIVKGRILLPKGMEIGLDVSRDVLIFDGEVPSFEDEDEGVSMSSWRNRRKWWWYGEDEDGYGLPWTPQKQKHKKNPPPPRDPLPDPLPERAFGHIRPKEWLNARSVRVDLDEDDSEDSADDHAEGAGGGVGVGAREGKGKREKGKGKGKEGKEKVTGAVYAVTAKVVDVPLEVLPGRQKEFSNFVSKVIWNSDGALAGLQGTAAVGLTVEGLPLSSSPSSSSFSASSSKQGAQATSNYLVLAGLPFQGSVRINKKNLLKGESTMVESLVP